MDDARNRLRLYLVKEDDLLFLFMDQYHPLWKVRIPYATNLPPGAKVVGLPIQDWRRRGFAFRVRHESFDVVPDGAEIPYADQLQWQVLEARLQDGDAAVVDAALDEARRLRMIFSDFLQDTEVARLAYEQGKADGRKEVWAELGKAGKIGGGVGFTCGSELLVLGADPHQILPGTGLVYDTNAWRPCQGDEVATAVALERPRDGSLRIRII